MDLNDANIRLERRVLERTTELYLKNKELNKEILEREQLQRQVSHAQRMESLGTLASGIAHDFNNILAIVAIHASLLAASESSSEEARKRAAVILRVGERGAGLVRQLLSLARKSDANKEPVYINDIVIELRQLLEETLPRTIVVDLKLCDSIYPFLGDKTLIHQALLNLCLNARDAMPEGGCITIASAMVSGHSLAEQFAEATELSYVSLTVRDTGIGMDEETQQRVFEPFFTTKETDKGTGLGLAVTKGAVRSHKGFIRTQSNLGEGTSFTLYFPAMRLPLSLESTDENFVADIAGGTETILLVEDEEELLAMLRHSLASKGYTVFTATNGIDAVNIFRDHKENIDVLLSDIGLPGMDGVRVYQQIREMAPHIKPILVSGFLDANLKERLRELGVESFLHKPYNIAEVLMRVRDVLTVNPMDNAVPPAS